VSVEISYKQASIVEKQTKSNSVCWI